MDTPAMRGHLRFRFLRIKRIDLRTHQHIGQHQVLETLNPTRTTRLIIILEGFEKVRMRLFPAGFGHVHLAAALSDNSHYSWMRNGSLDVQGTLVKLLYCLVKCELASSTRVRTFSFLLFFVAVYI